MGKNAPKVTPNETKMAEIEKNRRHKLKWTAPAVMGWEKFKIVGRNASKITRTKCQAIQNKPKASKIIQYKPK